LRRCSDSFFEHLVAAVTLTPALSRTVSKSVASPRVNLKHSAADLLTAQEREIAISPNRNPRHASPLSCAAT